MNKEFEARSRPRACAAIIKNDHILMVKMKRGDKVWWSLPGGGLEEGESFEETVVREVKEEVNLSVKVDRHLFTYDYGAGECRVFSTDLMGSHVPQLGYDPEYAGDEQKLQEVKWWPLEAMKDDLEVSRVIEQMNIMTK
ncbi:NUDIX domain-containing protein [Bacillus sp. Marseille-Q1617]|uniref:NUDIX domain-containing protein n=1 Tax=Bacillus sp. Marseille-Q1617 TaxID=2736887 RepID=UPI00158B5131|nr:NUDIX hydrolase [Bacillus sp. Marseille-Q1617]